MRERLKRRYSRVCDELGAVGSWALRCCGFDRFWETGWALSAIVMKSLSKNPTHRYQSAKDLATDLTDALGGGKLSELQREVKSGSLRRKRARKRNIGIAAVSLITATLTVMWLYSIPPFTPTQVFSSVAVLQLENTGPLPEETKWLPGGITETITNKLIRLPDLRVTPWQSASRYSVRNQDPSERRP